MKKGCGLEGGPARYKTPTRGRLRRSADRTHAQFLVSKRCYNETHPRLDSRFSMSELGRGFFTTSAKRDIPCKCIVKLRAPGRQGRSSALGCERVGLRARRVASASG